MRDKLSVKPEAVWEDCIDAVEALMETRNPLWNRRQKSFSLVLAENEALTSFIARQKEAWTQAKVEKMTIEEYKMVHLVKMIPQQKLREDCTEILSTGGAKLEDIESKIAKSEQNRNMAEDLKPGAAPADKSNATYGRNGGNNGPPRPDRSDISPR